MSTNLVRNLFLAALALLATSTARAQSYLGYDLVKVGDAGNTADSTGYGAVSTDYWIGKNLVTMGQYVDFLNAVAKTDDRGLYDSLMGTNAAAGYITRTGANGTWVYSASGPAGSTPVGAQSATNRPITYTSWFDAARFANWMANGKPTGAAGNATTDNGAYNLGTATTGNVVARNSINPNTSLAPTFFLPTENQWYKAAYYKGGSTNAGYWTYGTRSDTLPGNGASVGGVAMAGKDLANQMNANFGSKGAVTNAALGGGQNYLTEVGTFTNSYSAYGAFDMGGQAYQATDTSGTSAQQAIFRGGSYQNTTVAKSDSRLSYTTNAALNNVGAFRLVSSVPEPATLGMASTGAFFIGGWWILERRRRARA